METNNIILNIDIDLSEYPTKSILVMYQFILGFHLGGQLSTEEQKAATPTIEVFEKLCSSIRQTYLAQKSTSIKEIEIVEAESLKLLTEQLMLSEEQTDKLHKDFIKKFIKYRASLEAPEN